jgi:hypothetical protein
MEFERRREPDAEGRNLERRTRGTIAGCRPGSRGVRQLDRTSGEIRSGQRAANVR